MAPTGRAALPGPAFDGLQCQGVIPRLIAQATGAIVCASGGGYIYYGSGGSAGLHTDLYGHDLVLLTLLSGSVEPLHYHLHLVDTPLDEVADLAEATNGFPEGGATVDINEVPFLLSGQRIPHHRAPQERDMETVVVAQFFAPLLPLAPRGTNQTSQSDHERDREELGP